MDLTVKQVTEELPEYAQVCELMETAFPKDEQIPVPLLLEKAQQKDFHFRAFFDGDLFCGILFTIENEKYLLVLFLAVNEKIRSAGYGSRILAWLKSNTQKIIVLNVEMLNPAAKNNEQRIKRIRFYEKNGITDTGFSIVAKDRQNEPLCVLSSAPQSFVGQEFLALVDEKYCRDHYTEYKH